jgi:two-component system, sensor histidine kinase and response regulator
MLKFKSASSDEVLDKVAIPRALNPDHRLLVVDDEPDILRALSALFSPLYHVQTADSGTKALELIQEGFRPQVILADQRMPVMSGTEFLARTIKLVPRTVRVVLTGYTDVHDLTDSINRGNVYRFLTKPWRNADLLEIIRICFDHFFLYEEKIELEDAMRRLVELNRDKNEILALVAHDLRNPLSAMAGVADTIQNAQEFGLSFEDCTRLAGDIVTSAFRANRLLKNILQVYAIESDRYEFQRVVFKPASIIEMIVLDMSMSLAKPKNITVYTAYEDGDVEVYMDETSCFQVVENLLSNAIKYSPEGKSVWINVQKSMTSQEGEVVRIAVKDEGPGLTDDDKKRLFEKFARLSARPTAGEDSTGLGLAIVKKLVEAMDGRVWCESEAGEGATFIVEFPRYVSQEVPQNVPQEVSQA